MTTLDGCIFGWSLTPEMNASVIHHVGIVLKWNSYDVWGSIVAHYGINGNPVVVVETLGDAVDRSRPLLV
jgi:hypothetical protein